MPACAAVVTLSTPPLVGPDGKAIGQLPEQMPYLEWLHSDYRGKQTCQQCHMPAVSEPVAVASLLGKPREGVRLHTFTGANFLIEGMLGAHRDDLAVAAQPSDLAAASAHITSFLQSQSARVTLGPASLSGSDLSFAVRVENLTGHKLPTAYPSRRAWLHVVVTAADGRVVFESGKLNPDGSIAGNANDADPTRFSPHYTRITQPDQVQIFEPILGDSQGRVTTGLLSATQYLKDNRILPAGFDKSTAPPDIAVQGEAAADPDFTAGSSTTHYAVSTDGAASPLHICCSNSSTSPSATAGPITSRLIRQPSRNDLSATTIRPPRTLPSFSPTLKPPSTQPLEHSRHFGRCLLVPTRSISR